MKLKLQIFSYYFVGLQNAMAQVDRGSYDTAGNNVSQANRNINLYDEC